MKAPSRPAPLDPRHVALLARIVAAQGDARVKRALTGVPSRWREWGGFADFCAEEMKIVNKQKQLVRFVLNAMQRSVVAKEIRLRRAGKKPWQIVLKHRKVGITTLEQVLSYWTIWREPHQECMTIAHRPDDTHMIFRMVTRLWDQQPEDHRHDKTEAAISKMEFKKWDGIFVAATAGAGTARGATLSRLHGSECAFWPNMNETHTGLAKSIGETSAYVLESTPNGQEGRGQSFYEFWDGAKRGLNDFQPVFLPWFSDPNNRIALLEPDEIDDVLRSEEDVRELMERHKLDKAQMKWWLSERRGISATGRTATKIHQEHPSDDETCFLMSVSSYFDEDLLVVTGKRCVPPLAIEENGRLRIWDVPDADEPATYVMGCDPSEGVGSDSSAIVGYNLKTGKQAFTWSHDRTSPGFLGSDVLPRLGRRWANPSNGTPAYIVVESNNHGHATLLGLLSIAKYPKDRVYHQIDMTKVDDANDAKMSARPGWNHGMKEHAELTDVLGRQLIDGSPQVLDANVVTSIRKVGSGPSGADFGGRDEAVANGLALIGWPHAGAASPYAWINGQIVTL